MINPIVQKMMSSALNGKIGASEGMFENLMRTNPQFKQFVDENKGLSAKQIAGKYGIDLSQLFRR